VRNAPTLMFDDKARRTSDFSDWSLVLLSQKVAFYEVGWRAQNRRRGDSGHQREAESVKRRDSRQHGGCDGSSTIWDD
jgi:hypothetical protein